MQVKDLGDEAIQEILAEAVDGMDRRTGKPWRLALDGVHGDLTMTCLGKHVTTANVRPMLGEPREDELAPPEAIRLRTALRRLVLEATQAVSPVPGVADIPGALSCAFLAIHAVDAAAENRDLSLLPSIRHDIHRIVDHLTGNDHSGCSSKSSAADYGKPLAAPDAAPEPMPSWTQTVVEPLPPQIIFVNGQAVAVPRDPSDHVVGVAARAIEMAKYEVNRGWEIKDEAGEILGLRDDPNAVRFISLRAGVAS